MAAPRNRVFSGLLVLLLICTVFARPTTIRIETNDEDGASVGFGGRNLIMTSPAKTPAGGVEVVIHHSDQPLQVHIGAEPSLDTDAYRRTLAATLCHNKSCSMPPIHWNANNTYKIKKNVKKLLRRYYQKLNANKWD